MFDRFIDNFNHYVTTQYLMRFDIESLSIMLALVAFDSAVIIAALVSLF